MTLIRGQNHAAACRGLQNAGTSSGRSLIAVLMFICVAAGIYSLYFKPNPPPQPEANNAQASPLKKSEVVLFYSAPSCEPCDRARAWMKRRNIRFEERDVERWPPYKRELETYGGRVVPLIIVNGEAQHGFFPAYFEAALRGESTATN